MPFTIQAFRLWFVLCFASLSMVAQTPAPPASPATSQPPTELRYLDVQVVREANGQPVTRLALRDFQLFEDGIERPIREISHGRLPLSVLLLVDVSQAYQPAINELKANLANALSKLSERDEAALIAFSERAELRQSFTNDRRVIADSFAALASPHWAKTLGKKPNLLNALNLADTQMESRSSLRRRVIVLMTTENTTALWFDQSGYDLANNPAALQSGSIICGLLLTKKPSGFKRMLQVMEAVMTEGASLLIEPSRVARAWSLRTGGETFGAQKEGLSSGLASILERLRDRVIIGFEPKDKTLDNCFRTIQLLISAEVETREGQVTVNVAEGYIARTGNQTKSGNVSSPAGETEKK